MSRSSASARQRVAASFDFVEFRHDSANQASLMALAAPSFDFVEFRHDSAKHDRIEKVDPLDTKFKMDEDFEATEFFNDNYGTVVDDKIESQRIVLRAYGYEPYYLRDLPLHHEIA